MKYHTQSIDIVLNTESDLYRRLAENAAREHTTVSCLIEDLMLAGLYHDLWRKLDLMERRDSDE